MSQKLISLGNFGLGDTVVFVHRRAAGHPPPTLFGSGGDSGSLTARKGTRPHPGNVICLQRAT